MTLPLPAVEDLLQPPHVAVLRRTRPVEVPPGEAWTIVEWDRAELDPRDGFDPTAPTGWRIPVGGYWFATTSPLYAAARETFTMHAAVFIDGEIDPYAQVLQSCRGDGASQDLPVRERPLVRHVLPFGAHLRADAGQVVTLGLRHSLPGVLLVWSDAAGLGWCLERC